MHDVSIEGGTVEATGSDYGIYDYDSITITGGTVTAIGGKAAFSAAPNLSGHGEYTFHVGNSTTGEDAELWMGENTAELVLYKYVKIEKKGYPLWVGGVQVSEEIKDNILDQRDENGVSTAAFDPDTNTLTLNDPKITKAYNALIFSEGIDLTVTGNATLENAALTRTLSIFEGNLTLRGADLTIDSEKDGIWGDCDITITDDSKITVTSEARGIYSPGGKITISNSTVEATGSSGIVTLNGDITISGSTVKAEGRSGSSGLQTHSYSYSSRITISDSTVTAKGGNAGNGVKGDYLDITSGTVHIEDGKRAAWLNGVNISGGTVTFEGRVDQSHGDLTYPAAQLLPAGYWMYPAFLSPVIRQKWRPGKA